FGAYGHEGHVVPPGITVVVTSEPQRSVARVAHVGGCEGRVPGGGRQRHLDIGPEATGIQVVVFLSDERAVGQLRLEMEGVRRAAGVECTDDRLPARSIRVDAPNTP